MTVALPIGSKKIKPIYKKIIKRFGNRGLLRFYPVKVLHNSLISYTTSDCVEIQGSKMFVNQLFRNASFSGIWEPLQTEIVKKEIKKGDIIIDLGANIGYYTLLFSRLVGNEGKVYAFEPDPNNFALLEKNVKENGYTNIVLEQKAVSDFEGTTKLYISNINTGGHRIFDIGANEEFIKIETIKLDDYLQDKKVDFIKMDIQGSEAKAIMGMKNIISQNQSLKIISEFAPFLLKKSGCDPMLYTNLLLEQGFELYELDKKSNKVVKTKLDKLNRDEKLENQTNLLWIK